jgi:hypothetical protein
MAGLLSFLVLARPIFATATLGMGPLAVIRTANRSVSFEFCVHIR